jgi:hypothetical protein
MVAGHALSFCERGDYIFVFVTSSANKKADFQLQGLLQHDKSPGFVDVVSRATGPFVNIRRCIMYGSVRFSVSRQHAARQRPGVSTLAGATCHGMSFRRRVSRSVAFNSSWHGWPFLVVNTFF